jgi:threonine aldolase
MLGVCWTQGGAVAAGCLTALRTMRDRIPEDHARARRLAEALDAVPGLAVDRSRVATNILFMRLEEETADPARFAAAVEAEGFRIGRFKPGRVARLVTHHDVDDAAVERFVEVAARAIAGARRVGA